MEPSLDIDRVLGPRDVVVVDGIDAAKYLQSQVSQDLNGMDVGDRRWTLVLNPMGKIESLARVTRTGENRFELDTDAGFGDSLLERINRFKIRVAADTSLTAAVTNELSPDRESERVAVGWPRMGAEIIPGETIPGGTGLAGVAVSFTKGCYPGQELVERMDSRAAEAPRSLRRLDVSSGAAPGDAITDAGDDVGALTSVAGTQAIGWVKRSSEVGTDIEF